MEKMNKPQIPIEVGDDGVWSTDGLPMLYVPRHFFMNNHFAVSEVVGADKYADILYKAGYKSAYHWCSHESEEQNLKGIEVFHHYLARLSQRGWGQFSLIKEDIAGGEFSVKVLNSAFALHCKHFKDSNQAGNKICFMFAGWFAAAADWVSASEGVGMRHNSQEVSCAMQGQNDCLFSITEENND